MARAAFRRISAARWPWLNGAAPFRTMSIDKESTGLPEIDLHRRTTKVNFAVGAGIVVFFIIAGAVIVWFAMHHG
jgi:hypothetical protein